MAVLRSPAARAESELPYLDVDSEAFRADAAAVLREARAGDRFLFSRRGIEVLAHADVQALLADPRLETQDAHVYRRYGAQPMLSSFAEHGLLVALHGEKHDRIRRVFLAAFRARIVNDARPMMREVARNLVAALPDGAAPIDFVEAFSSPFPMTVLCRMIGIPVADIPAFSAAATTLHLLAATPIEPGFPEIERALSTLREYCLALVDARTRDPQDDIISGLIQAQVTQGRISDDELAWNVANLIFAGQDTTRYQLASAVRAVVAEDGMWERMHAEPELVEQVAEETLRVQPVVNFVVRVAQEDFEFGGDDGVHIGRGRRVILNVQAASRDPEHFGAPQQFCPRGTGRHDESFDVPFGLGDHYCLGAGLARAEVQEALGVLSQELTDVEVVDAPRMTAPAAMLYGPEDLQITFARRA
ncbi:cytochrome P450 [uncultured Jatrophihabitans sp.]|uniref:cytochrome P450 n=1 Tax=uncultured Jatrophihabitans sp. TaxID=1610747 RepID=UPI0035CA12B7